MADETAGSEVLVVATQEVAGIRLTVNQNHTWIEVFVASDLRTTTGRDNVIVTGRL
jgi:hypothetical protein